MHPEYPKLSKSEVKKVQAIVRKGLVGRSLGWRAICARPELAKRAIREFS